MKILKIYPHHIAQSGVRLTGSAFVFEGLFFMKKGIDIVRPQCSASFYISQCFIGKRKYCSYKCHNEAMVIPKEKLNCHDCGKEYELHKSYLRVRKSRFCSKACQDNASMKIFGAASRNFKGNPKTLKRPRKGAQWKRWRKSVYKRDNYTCRMCGVVSDSNLSIPLHPHHIRQFAFYTELRFDIDNGVTVCLPCHKSIPHYKNKDNCIKNEAYLTSLFKP